MKKSIFVLKMRKVRKWFVRTRTTAGEIQWRMEGTNLTKEKLVGWLKENKSLMDTDKIKSLFETYRQSVNYNKVITNSDRLIEFLNGNNDWYNLIFK
jgi:hypothetical protein